ncbi:MFS transporter [Neofusicoccum parvum]|nr:MFS transporter [Neofusicoccum parvum]
MVKVPSINPSVVPSIVPLRAKRWQNWFADDDTPEERKLIVKLDLLIVPYAFAVYWVKYLDQANINNAYVAGLSDELGFHGNELVHLQTMYVVGAVVGQIPFAWLFTKVRMQWLLPGMDMAWGVFTLLQYRAAGYSELMAYRFMVGLFESAYFPGVHYVLGAWYRGHELGRRGGVFYVGLTLGTLTAGLIQSAASSTLDGVHGLSGWRWMYIICSGITFFMGILGIFIFPGTPDMPNKLVLKEHDVELAKRRLEKDGPRATGHLTWRTIKNIVTSWKLYILIIWDIFFWNGSINTSAGGYLLWLKSLHRYSSAKVNALGSTAPAIGIFYVLFICFGSDLFLGRTGAIVLACVWNLIGLIILSVWNVPESALWFAFNTMYSAVALSSVLYGWANDILRHHPDERSFMLIAMNAISQSTTAWTPLLVFKTVEAPRFPKGYPFVAASAFACILMTFVVRYLHNREEENRKLKEESVDGETQPGTPPNSVIDSDVGTANVREIMVENKFAPENVTAQVGDVVKFEFWPTNNSVARSEFAYPCVPYSLTGASRVGLGFYSGFKPIVANLAQPAYYLAINRVTPIFFYNTAPGACIDHQMVGVINPRDATQLSLQKEAAAAATLALSPGEPIPQGSSVSSFDTSTATATATSTSTSSPPSSHPASLSPGAIAGIVIGALAFFAVLGVGIWALRHVRKPHVPRSHRPYSEPDLTSLGTTPRSPVTPHTAVSELPGNTIDGVLVGGGGWRPESEERLYVVSPPWTPQQEHLGRGGGAAVSVFEPRQQGRGRLGVVSELSAYGEVRKDQ